MMIEVSAEEYACLKAKEQLLDKMMQYPNCNTCDISKVCKVKPAWGDNVVYNCPLYVGFGYCKCERMDGDKE